MRKSSKDVEAVIEEYLRKRKSGGNIDEFIRACQNFKALILDVKNKGRVITSKDIFNNTRSSDTLKEPSSLLYKEEEKGSHHNLKENCVYREDDHNIRMQSVNNINCIARNKPNQESRTGYENPPTLSELNSDSDDIMNIIAKLKLAHLISPSVDKYIQTDEFVKNIALFNQGTLEEFEKSLATTSRKQNDSKCDAFKINDIDVSELKLISSDDHSTTSTFIEKPTKLLTKVDDDKTPNHLKNDTIVEETETDLHTDKYLQHKDNLKPNQEVVKRLPFKPEIGSNNDEPQTSKYIKQIEDQLIDAEQFDRNETDIIDENSTVNIIHADVDNNNKTNSKDCLGRYERKVREVIKTKRLYNKDGTINEVTETVIITRQIHDPIVTTLDDTLKMQPVISDETTFDQLERDDVIFFTAPDHNMQGFKEGKDNKCKKGKSSNNCKVARRAESYIRQCLSCSDIDKLEDSDNEEQMRKKAQKEKITKII